MNHAGYRADVIRRLGPDNDREPAQLIESEEDFSAVRVRNRNWVVTQVRTRQGLERKSDCIPTTCNVPTSSMGRLSVQLYKL